MTFVVLLAGGVGERFWPRSRMRFPKQFLAIDGKKNLITRSLQHLSGIPRKRIRIVVPKDQKTIFSRRYPSLKRLILWEPSGKSTAAAIAFAAFEIAKQDPQATLIVLPCDQWIPEGKRFRETLKQAEAVAKHFDGIVTIGVKPSYPATGFGYICHHGALERFGRSRAYRVKRFIEKPSLQRAKRLSRERSTLWNIGIFAFRIPVVLQAFRTHMPGLYQGFQRTMRIENSSARQKGLLRLYRRLRSVSFDHGVMERCKRCAVVPGRFGWGDLGSWRSVEMLISPDRDGNCFMGDAHVVRGKGNIFISEKGHLLAGIGVSGLIAIHTPDATLLCPKERAEEVKQLVRSLRKRKSFRRYL